MTNAVSTLEMTHDEWLAKRLGTIGSSEIGTILGLNPYETARKLFLVKTGQEPPFAGNDATEWGTELEPFAATMFNKKSAAYLAGRRVQRDNKIRIHPDYPWATCNLDRLIVGDGSPVIVELKTATSRAVDAWMNREEQVPLAYVAQVQWQMFVTGYKKAVLWLVVLDTHKCIPLEFEYEPKYAEEIMLPAAVSFLEAVRTNNIELVPAALPDVEQMKPEPGSTVEASEDIRRAVEQLADIKARKSQLEKEEKAVAADIKLYLDKHETLTSGGQVIASYKLQHRDGYTVEATDYRTLTLPRAKKEKKS